MNFVGMGDVSGFNATKNKWLLSMEIPQSCGAEFYNIPV